MEHGTIKTATLEETNDRKHMDINRFCCSLLVCVCVSSPSRKAIKGKHVLCDAYRLTTGDGTWMRIVPIALAAYNLGLPC